MHCTSTSMYKCVASHETSDQVKIGSQASWSSNHSPQHIQYTVGGPAAHQLIRCFTRRPRFRATGARWQTKGTSQGGKNQMQVINASNEDWQPNHFSGCIFGSQINGLHLKVLLELSPRPKTSASPHLGPRSRLPPGQVLTLDSNAVRALRQNYVATKSMGRKSILFFAK